MELNSVLKTAALALTVFFCLSGAPAQANEAMRFDSATVGELDGKLAELVAGGETPGVAVIVFKDGQEVYGKFLGNRNLAEPMTRDSKFRISGVSKMFTAFTIMQMAERQIITLDMDVSPYLGFELRNPAYPDVPITFRMLLNHTSSIRDDLLVSSPPVISVKEFFYPLGMYWDKGVHFAQEGEPGEHFAYAELNYGLLGTIIEALTRQRFDRFQKSNIFTQLNIAADYVPSNLDDKGFANLGTLYQKKDGVWQATMDDFKERPERESAALQNPLSPDQQGKFNLKNYFRGTNATIFSPGGGLRISAGELATTLEMILSQGKYRQKPVLTPEGLKALTDKAVTVEAGEFSGYGFGFAYVKPPGGNIELCGHTGNEYGVRAGLFFVPGTRDGFLYIANGSAGADPVLPVLCRALFKTDIANP